ncbi:hypothetical protein [Methylobacterium nigriterrae]|uniref:hypothetical protein n=1 Tax=Methylobacterium nigriterrae TaxID=3127512 RepID=UPI003013762B
MFGQVDNANSSYRFAVYPPSQPGMPWLSVCVGPDGDLVDANSFATCEAAAAATRRAQAFFNVLTAFSQPETGLAA